MEFDRPMTRRQSLGALAMAGAGLAGTRAVLTPALARATTREADDHVADGVGRERPSRNLRARNKTNRRKLWTRRYARPGTEAGWHFLTGKQPSIDAVTKAVGFGYVRIPSPDGKTTQFAHASAIQLVTPQGRIAQYYLGVEYSPKDLLLGLIDASGNKIGSPVANILTYCYHYDPQTNRHSLIVARACASIVCVGSGLAICLPLPTVIPSLALPIANGSFPYRNRHCINPSAAQCQVRRCTNPTQPRKFNAQMIAALLVHLL